VEGFLEAKRLSPETITEAATLAARVVDARDDRRASEAYRRTLTEVGIRRCLARVAGIKGEGAL
jgi:CO/xanthine dehydrogenase FAD-binding subunit